MIPDPLAHLCGPGIVHVHEYEVPRGIDATIIF